MRKKMSKFELDWENIDGMEGLYNPNDNYKIANNIIKIHEQEQSKDSTKSKKDYIAEKEQKIEDMKQEILGKIVFTDLNSSTPYVYNEECGIYEQMTYNKIKDTVRKEFIEMPYVMGTDVNMIADTLHAVYQSCTIQQDFKKFIKDDELIISFNNGTLHLKKEKDGTIEYDLKKHDPKDFSILKLNMDWEDLTNFKEEDSIFLAWIKKKFKNKNYQGFFATYVADLLQPFNYSQTALFLWGAGGIGKNVFESILKQNITGNISALEVEDLGKRFQATALIESVINISNEISKKDVNSKMFNKFISRENMMFEYKGRDTFTARPLAKWLIFANSPLNIEMTSGVRRRILSLEMEEERITEWQGKPISKHDFEKLMLEDKKGFLLFLIAGTKELMKFNLDVKSVYDAFVGEGENEKLEEHNQSQLQDFLQANLIQDKNSAVLIRDLAEVFNYLVKETDDPIVAGAEVVTPKKLGFELRNSKYKKNLILLDNPKRGLKKGTYLLGYKFAMENEKIKIENIDKVDSIEFLRSEIKKK